MQFSVEFRYGGFFFVEALRCTFRCHAEVGLEFSLIPCGWMKPYVISFTSNISE